jgi:hypothetical protein
VLYQALSDSCDNRRLDDQRSRSILRDSQVLTLNGGDASVRRSWRHDEVSVLHHSRSSSSAVSLRYVTSHDDGSGGEPIFSIWGGCKRFIRNLSRGTISIDLPVWVTQADLDYETPSEDVDSKGCYTVSLEAGEIICVRKWLCLRLPGLKVGLAACILPVSR